MSSRQLRKLQEQNKVTEEEFSEEEPETKVVNNFADLDDFEIISSEEEELPATTSKLLKQEQNTQPEENLDLLLEELKESSIGTPQEQKPYVSCLKRHPKHFDPQNELSKLFKEERKSKKKAKRNFKKLMLTPDKTDWPLNLDHLLVMEKVPDPVKNLFYFDMTKKYSNLQPEYLSCVESNDPNAIAGFLQKYPFHVEALFQLVLVYQMQGNFEQVGSLLERMLYSFQLSFHHQFSPIGSDIAMDISLNQFNKIFYKGLFTNVDCLGRKGCARTALEFVKFILALSPQEDPLGCLFLVDYYSIRSRKLSYFLEFTDNYMEEFYGFGELIMLPSIMYSTALCKALMNETFECTNSHVSRCSEVKGFSELRQQEASVILLCAVRLYPGLAKALISKLFPAFQFGEVDYQTFLGNTQKTSEIYASRNEELWKPEKISSWLKACIEKSSEITLSSQDFQDTRFSELLDRYSHLDSNEFSFDVRRVIPEDMEVGRRGPVGNLDPNANPFYLFFASMLPWNYVNFQE